MKPDIVDELFKKYYSEAMLYTMSLCKNKTIAEDIVSSAFYKALETADDEIRNFKAWLFTVCRNEFISLCRKDTRFTGNEPDEEYADDSESVLEKLIKSDEYRALYHAISLLEPKCKEAILLHYFSGLQIKDISQVINTSEANVKVLLYRGRLKIKEIMEKEI